MTKPSRDDDMPEAGEQASVSQSSENDDGAGHAGWSVDSTLHPLMQHQTASVAAAAAVGFGIASHFAGFMLGAMQGFMDAAQKSRAAQTDRAPAETAGDAAPDAEVDAPESDAGGEDLTAEPALDAAGAAGEGETPVAVARAPRPAARVRSAKVDGPVAVPRAAVQDTVPKAARKRRGKGEDDLKRIAGVGPKLEQVLKGLDVTRFAQIAAWDEADIQKFDAALGVNGRIVRDRWVEQAKALVKA